jgi:hypothetical protein
VRKYTPQQIEANRQRDARWRTANRDKCRAATARYRLRNPEAARLSTRASTARWRETNPNSAMATQRRYAAKHAETIRRRSAEYRVRNLEKVRARESEYRARNAQARLERNRKYRELNRAKVRAAASKVYAEAMRAIPGWAEHEIIELIYAEAAHRALEVDHVIPLRGKLVCGLHVHINMQLLTRSQNARKRNSFHPDDHRTFA